MRAKRTAQISLFDPQALDHPVADELEWASAWLDAHPELLEPPSTLCKRTSMAGQGRARAVTA